MINVRSATTTSSYSIRGFFRKMCIRDRSMGRQVKKGEKGITIIAPAPIKRKKEQAVLDQDQKPVIGPDGKPKTEEVEVTLPCFKAITVFDIEQRCV